MTKQELKILSSLTKPLKQNKDGCFTDGPDFISVFRVINRKEAEEIYNILNE